MVERESSVRVWSECAAERERSGREMEKVGAGVGGGVGGGWQREREVSVRCREGAREGGKTETWVVGRETFRSGREREGWAGGGRGGREERRELAAARVSLVTCTMGQRDREMEDGAVGVEGDEDRRISSRERGGVRGAGSGGAGGAK